MAFSTRSRTTTQQEGDLPASPPAQRLRRPRWTDARLLVGAALVLGATATGAAVLGQGEGPQHWVAAADLPTGHVLTEADLRPVDGSSPQGVYLSGDDPLGGEDSVLVQPISQGQFVPTAAVAGPDQVDLRRVSLQVDAGSAAMLTPGSSVDLWSTPKATAGSKERPSPQRVLESAEVARVASTDSRLAGSAQSVAVDFLVPPDQVKEVLAATTGDAQVTAVPVTGGGSDS